MRDKITMLCSAAALSCACMTGAHAAGYEILEQSAITQGNAYAGAGARADDPSTMFFNPASLTHLPGIQISGGLSAILPGGNLVSGSATAGGLLGYAPYKGPVGSSGPGVNALVPNFYLSGQVTDQLFLGLAVTAPYGLATKYPADSIARYYALTSQLRTVNIGPTVAWRLLPNLSIGGGVNVRSFSL